jgi:hypothetical protein
MRTDKAYYIQAAKDEEKRNAKRKRAAFEAEVRSIREAAELERQNTPVATPSKLQGEVGMIIFLIICWCLFWPLGLCLTICLCIGANSKR